MPIIKVVYLLFDHKKDTHFSTTDVDALTEVLRTHYSFGLNVLDNIKETLLSDNTPIVLKYPNLSIIRLTEIR